MAAGAGDRSGRAGACGRSSSRRCGSLRTPGHRRRRRRRRRPSSWPCGAWSRCRRPGRRCRCGRRWPRCRNRTRGSWRTSPWPDRTPCSARWPCGRGSAGRCRGCWRTCSRPPQRGCAVLWQPAPVEAQPVEEAAACSVASTEAWTASVPVWQAAHALVVSFADQLLAIAVVDAVLLWQFRQTCWRCRSWPTSPARARRSDRRRPRGRRHTRCSRTWRWPGRSWSGRGWPPGSGSYRPCRSSGSRRPNRRSWPSAWRPAGWRRGSPTSVQPAASLCSAWTS